MAASCLPSSQRAKALRYLAFVLAGLIARDSEASCSASDHLWSPTYAAARFAWSTEWNSGGTSNTWPDSASQMAL
eukprot:1793133-Lingulodinium_polyedra.AAC.1